MAEIGETWVSTSWVAVGGWVVGSWGAEATVDVPEDDTESGGWLDWDYPQSAPVKPKKRPLRTFHHHVFPARLNALGGRVHMRVERRMRVVSANAHAVGGRVAMTLVETPTAQADELLMAVAWFSRGA